MGGSLGNCFTPGYLYFDRLSAKLSWVELALFSPDPDKLRKLPDKRGSSKISRGNSKIIRGSSQISWGSLMKVYFKMISNL